MRTDAKIGFAIVGVLLAVLVVYAVVIPGRHKTKLATNAPPTAHVTPDAPADGGSVFVPPANASPDTAPPTVTPPAKPAEPAALPAPQPSANANPLAQNSGQPAPVVPLTPDDPSGPLIDTTPLAPGPVAHPNADHPALARTPADAPPATPHHRRHPAPLDDGSAMTAAADHSYTVRPGQTLSSIAAEVYGNSRYWVQIERSNPKLNPARLKVGTKIMIPDPAAVRPHPAVVVPAADVIVADDLEMPAPAGQTYRVKPGDSLYKIAKRYLGSGRRADAVYELNRDVIGPDMGRLRRGMVLRLPSAAGEMTDIAH